MIIGKSKQLASNLTQDFVVRQESALYPLWGNRAIHNFDGAVSGKEISGTVDLAEYGTAKFTARRRWA